MSIMDTRIAAVRKLAGGKAADRLKHELGYARRVSEALNNKYYELIFGALDLIDRAVAEDGVLTDGKALEAEQYLMPMQADCKKYRLMLCGHAHIDMNWMWRYDETVQITLDTFATVLKLMREFPEFTFSQSQASVYRIVEENDPDMLEEIRARAQEGRWEVSASTWVEADRNMPSSESVARHHLYTLNYLPGLLGVKRAEVDFEPDTFGHHQNTPDMLAQAGVKYYYHCRGFQDEVLYRWRAPSGAEILVYREPFWYNGAVEGDIAEYAPLFCEKYGVESALRVYGVGDHGGGPTRRDLRRIVDMQSWPIYATVEFGTYARFFEQAAKATKEIPVVQQELNAVFTGCYTTQTCIKKGNRYGEKLLGNAETVNAIASAVAGAPYRTERFEQGWRNVLFNQFHDILPGSGIDGTRQYAMGLYQDTYAIANSARRKAMKAISDKIDTSAIKTVPLCGDTSTGAGVGFRVNDDITLARVEAGQGANRIFHLFNDCAADRRDVVELIVWDWSRDMGKMEATDASGHPIPCQVIEQGYNEYWGHSFTRVFVEADIPAMGYATVVIRPAEDISEPIEAKMARDPRVEQDDMWSIENEHLCVECDPAVHQGALIITDKATGESFVADGFSMITEDASRGMTAWVLGDQLEDCHVSGAAMKRTASGPLYNELTASVLLGERSKMTYTISLAKGSRQVIIDAKCDWLETADVTLKRVPQLFFRVMADDACRTEYTYDIPGGVITREASQQDLPGIRFIAGGRLMLMCDSRYGYRGDVGSMGVTLLRSTCDPDPYPEQGEHKFRLAVAVTEGETAGERTGQAALFMNPVTPVSGEQHEGCLPAAKSFVRVASGSVELTAVKLSEDKKALILRGVELTGCGKDVCIELGMNVKSARFTDTLEEAEGAGIACDNGRLTFDTRPYGMFSIRAELK